MLIFKKMKTFKNIIILFITAGLFFACNDDEYGNLDALKSDVAPTNVKALFSVTQDNTGTVTITPSADGATSFKVDFGDGETVSEVLKAGENITHVYPEGEYSVNVMAYSLTGLETIEELPLIVSFKAPENLEVAITNDEAISKQVNVTVNADFAVSFDVYFGEAGNDEPVMANIGETASYVYQEPGTYTVRVVVKGAAIATTEYTEEFEVTAILQPLASAPMPPARFGGDVISIFSAAYEDVPGTDYFPDWGQGGQGSSWAMFELNGDQMLQYVNLSYQGIQLENSIDVSNMEYLHLDVWTAEDVNSIKTSIINNASGVVTEAPVTSNLTPNEWTSIDIPISDYIDQGLTVTEIFQMKFEGEPWAAGTVFIDNIYFWKSPEPASGLEGIWQIAPEAGALKVGPSPGSGEWWSNDAQTVTDRACYFDDTYVFSLDGSFANVLGEETWLETWQGVAAEQCGTPVAPHDGSGDATFVYDANMGTLTLDGSGAYIGLPKVNNEGELPNVSVPTSITYDVSLSDDNNTMTIGIESGSGVFWTFKLIRYIPPVAGTWQLAPEAGALMVGPSPGSGEWWSSDAQTVIDRACYFDDSYEFGSDGSFKNVQGTETWLETWQGVASEQCGTPVAPHDGSVTYTYGYDETNGTITLNGTGAYLGLPKVNNDGELPNVAVPASITYDVNMTDSNTMIVTIEAGTGVFWTYKLVK
ncbi:hypothetical protein SAMN04487906_0783 [Zhouia amylolytica]|uniref:PKD/Chitinase domain-containing protein n=2 Tax=Zhouia amylolytica TaxID=376730 RepID=A0A1I6QQ73_9FLAO|nr:hypothetical protein SAMN04487906_0783 [Zhouia amylolytica]